MPKSTEACWKGIETHWLSSVVDPSEHIYRSVGRAANKKLVNRHAIDKTRHPGNRNGIGRVDLVVLLQNGDAARVRGCGGHPNTISSNADTLPRRIEESHFARGGIDVNE